MLNRTSKKDQKVYWKMILYNATLMAVYYTFFIYSYVFHSEQID
jgi:hypothetical protein